MYWTDISITLDGHDESEGNSNDGQAIRQSAKDSNGKLGMYWSLMGQLPIELTLR